MGEVVYVRPYAVCMHIHCPCWQTVCSSRGDLAEFIPCPERNGRLWEAVRARMMELCLCWETYEQAEVDAILNPDDWPRLYSGDGRLYIPLIPVWGRKKGATHPPVIHP